MKFLHLSDLHLNQYPLGSAHDLDADVRDVMESDAGDLADRLGGIDGILVTGDIAFSGQNTEYAKAAVWFQRLAQRVGCDIDRVWVIPGNHDVDRSVLAAEPRLRTTHDHLRKCALKDLTRELSDHLLDKDKPPLLSPLGNYVSFAANYKCQISPERPFWVAELDATPGHRIVLCGLTSPILSDELDDEGANKLALGTFQFAVPWRPNDAVVVLCHHPPQWLRDGGEAEQYFDARAVLQLFGHKHVQRTGRWEDTVRLQSGALHPDRDAGWQPRYNVVRIEWQGNDIVRITVQPRVWWNDLTRFGPELTETGAQTRSWEVPLARPAAEAQAVELQEVAPGGGNAPQGQPAIASAEDVPADPTGSPDRRLVYGLSRLPHLAQFTLGQRLGLLTEEDQHLRSFQLVEALILRGQNTDRLKELWDAVATQESGDLFDLNPYEKEA